MPQLMSLALLGIVSKNLVKGKSILIISIHYYGYLEDEKIARKITTFYVFSGMHLVFNILLNTHDDI